MRDSSSNLDMEMEEPEMPALPSFFKRAFAFIVGLTLLLMAGGVYVVYLLLAHFGVVA